MEDPLVKLNLNTCQYILGDKKENDMSEKEFKILKGNKVIENVNFGDKAFKQILETKSDPMHEKAMFHHNFCINFYQ